MKGGELSAVIVAPGILLGRLPLIHVDAVWLRTCAHLLRGAAKGSDYDAAITTTTTTTTTV